LAHQTELLAQGGEVTHNALPVVILTLLIFFPSAIDSGNKPMHYGALVVLTVALGVPVPPIGMNVCAIHAVVKDVPLYDISGALYCFGLGLSK